MKGYMRADVISGAWLKDEPEGDNATKLIYSQTNHTKTSCRVCAISQREAGIRVVVKTTEAAAAAAVEEVVDGGPRSTTRSQVASMTGYLEARVNQRENVWRRERTMCRSP
jgi:hypothetical protein